MPLPAPLRTMSTSPGAASSPGSFDVSVIIVNWNTRDYLIDVIALLTATTKRASVEIIVVDNASVDGSADAVRERFPTVRLIQNDANLGFAKANNIGFRAARGRALCLVNTDVVAIDGVIDNLWEYLLSHPTVGAVGPRQLNREGLTRMNVRRFPNLANAAGDFLWLKKPGLLPGRAEHASTYDHTHPAQVLSGAFLMVRQEVVDEVGPLDEEFFFYGEDTDWCRRIHDAGWGIVYHPSAEAVHFGGGSSAAFPVRYYLTMEKADYLYWRKHHRASERAVYAALKVAHHVISMVAWSGIWMTKPTRRDLARLKIAGHAINTTWLVTRRSLI